MTAKKIAEFAVKGDELSRKIFRISAEKLGLGLYMLIDILNHEMIVIGSIFVKCHNLMWKYTKDVIAREALPASTAVCKIIPSTLGDELGDYAAIAVALEEADNERVI